MRPIKLHMTAFGPYKDTEVIDFTELEQHNLFVISGNTGSGKTTIFDGISFALYGTASGQDRDNYAMLRSDFADDDTHTAVELLFSFKERLFRILRQLGHIKEGNKSRTGERYEFFEIIDGKEVPFVDRQIVSEINEKIEQLIGLTQDQFKQIVMLPQGEFRKLLTSETENKEKILRRLFKTEPYKQINERLRGKMNTMEKVFFQEEQTRSNFIQHIPARLPEREESAIYQVLAEEHYNVNQIITSLETEIIYYKNQIEADEKLYNKAYEAHNKKQTDFHQSKILNDRFEELSKLEARLTELKSQQPLFEVKETQLQAAEKASHIEPYEQHVKDRKKEEAEQSLTLKQVEEDKIKAAEQFRKIKLIYAEEEKKEAERTKVNRELDQFQAFLPTVKDIDKQKRQLIELKQTKQKTFTKLTNIRKTITDATELLNKDSKIINELDESVRNLSGKRENLQKKREQAVLMRDYIKFSTDQANLKKEGLEKKEQLAKVREAYTKQEQFWLNNQASILSAHLHEGEACPVCGSEEHPHKATPGGDVLTREALDGLKKTVDKHDEQYRTISANYNVITTQLKQKETELKPYEVNLENIQTEMDRFIEQGTKLDKEVKELEAKETGLTKLRENHNNVTKQMEPLQVEEKKLNEQFQNERVKYEGIRAVFQERISVVPEEVQILSALEERIQKTEQLKVKLDNAWKEAQSNLQKARENQVNILANVESNKKRLEDAKAKREVAMKQFTEALSKALFETESLYREAKLVEESQHQLKTEIEQFKQTLATITKQAGDLTDLLKDKEKVDLASLKEQLDELKGKYEVALNARNRSKEYYAESRKLKTNIEESNERVKEAENELGIMKDLYDVVRGQNSSKISFERYLQIDYLEQIIDAANQRLKRLSNGQYLLMRSDRQESHGRQSGLALDVYDGYTGQTRDVKTLSGGEKFNASLCLALGMSDVIQSFQGNISINTMFIDEGFGSLDEESLNKSIETLIELQESGRMIGIISHVQELKTVFPAVLEVTKTQAGYSETEFLIK